MRSSPWVRWALLVLLLAGLVAGQSWLTYRFYTSRFPGGNDFLARWSNGCALIWSGQNPYSDTATLQTQLRMYGRPAEPGQDLAAFSYPFHAFFFFWPLCFVQPYPLVQAIWMALMLYALVAGTALAMRVTRWRPPAFLWALTLIWAVLNYPHARALILGQMVTIVFLAAILTLWALQRRADVWAGVALAVTTIKPQVSFLLVLWLLWWSAWRRRWRLWGGFAAALGLMGGAGLLLVPTWPLDFVRHVLNYDRVAGYSYHSLIWMLTRHFWDLGAAEIGVTALFGFYLLFEWYRLRRATGQAMLWVTGLTLNVTHFVAYRMATTSYSLLLLPLFQLFWLAQKRVPRRAHQIVLFVQGALLVVQWTVFLTTLDGRFETAPVYLIFPIPLLIAQIATRRQFLAREAASTLASSHARPLEERP